MDIQPGDVLEMKKEHPCGSRRWAVLRVGMDFRLRCEGCGREVMGPRQRSQLRRLIGFRFTRHPSINLPEERLESIETQLNARVRELLALPSA